MKFALIALCAATLFADEPTGHGLTILPSQTWLFAPPITQQTVPDSGIASVTIGHCYYILPSGPPLEISCGVIGVGHVSEDHLFNGREQEHLKPMLTWKERVSGAVWQLTENHRIIGHIYLDENQNFKVTIIGIPDESLWDDLDAAKAEAEAVYTDKVWK